MLAESLLGSLYGKIKPKIHKRGKMLDLYHRLGCKAGITVAVSRLVDRLVADDHISFFFQHIARDQARRDSFQNSLVLLICEITGGPEHYEGPDIRAAHQGKRISNAHFEIVLGHIKAVLDQARLDERSKSEVLNLLDPMRTEIVES